MTDRESAHVLLDKVPLSKLGYVIAYLKGITAGAADDDASQRGDDRFVSAEEIDAALRAAASASLSGEDEAGDKFVSLDDMMRGSGVYLG